MSRKKFGIPFDQIQTRYFCGVFAEGRYKVESMDFEWIGNIKKAVEYVRDKYHALPEDLDTMAVLVDFKKQLVYVEGGESKLISSQFPKHWGQRDKEI